MTALSRTLAATVVATVLAPLIIGINLARELRDIWCPEGPTADDPNTYTIIAWKEATS